MSNKEVTYSGEREFGDLHLDEIKRILGPYVIDTAPWCEDAIHNTDLTTSIKRISVRVRRDKYRKSFGRELTIRCSEWIKIMKGFGDIMFYAFADENNITQYTIYDLDVLRSTVKNNPGINYAANTKTNTTTNETSFVILNPANFVDSFVLGSWKKEN